MHRWKKIVSLVSKNLLLRIYAFRDIHLWLQKICTFVSKLICSSGCKKHAPLATKDMYLWLRIDLHFWFKKRFTSLAIKEMHLWIQKICTSGAKRNAPLPSKVTNLWLHKICIFCIKDMNYWLQNMRPIGFRVCTFESKWYETLATKDMKIWLQKICFFGYKKLWTSCYKIYDIIAFRDMHLCLQKIYTSGSK